MSKSASQFAYVLRFFQSFFRFTTRKSSLGMLSALLLFVLSVFFAYFWVVFLIFGLILFVMWLKANLGLILKLVLAVTGIWLVIQMFQFILKLFAVRPARAARSARPARALWGARK